MEQLTFEQAMEGCDKRILAQHIELILMVSANYNHIQDLEMLKNLLHDYESDYYKEYHQDHLRAIKLAYTIADAEQRARYAATKDKVKYADYVLKEIVPIHFPDIVKHNKHWKTFIEKVTYQWERSYIDTLKI